MSLITRNSRMAYPFSRDGAMPFSLFWHKVNGQEVPLNAVWSLALIAFCMALTSLGSLVAFQAMVSIATIRLYIAYALPIFFRVTLAQRSFTPGPFNLGLLPYILEFLRRNRFLQKEARPVSHGSEDITECDFVLMILIPMVTTEKTGTKFVFTHFNTDNGQGIYSRLYIFVLGLLMSQYTLTGYDASAHMASYTEETKDADKNGPKGIKCSIGISIAVGWCYIIGITYAATNIPHILNPDNDAGGYSIAEIFYEAFKSKYGNGMGGILCLCMVAAAIFFCGMSSITSNSR
ncbi:hypothetical protein BUALT_Bualt17G0103200 [Buddleja alternifolia]|uniref:Amino acid permease/ SLC12A domain-containing protein n=1 Tax=Buddleja alternifolia TaxID=168488 RepID=A0AAV6WCZ5_9LAMI|nr:hypothetical protein BUALT_Bualt17G0103200 [Buddleja alternifolia]